jgi:serine/threonine protein kinase
MVSPVEGTPFGRYRLVEVLGRGGMGEVWRAYDTITDRVVALKLLPANFADDHVFQERFRREARSAAGLDEPHIVPIHDFGEIDGRLFVTMRLIKGRDLQDLLGDGPLPPARAVRIIEQIASALHAAHEVGLVHRDVKPSNILIARDDFAYLIDFGIARAAGETGLTSTGATIGTWAYMAPERFETGTADARADIYALAGVFHECLTGELPYPGDSLPQQMHAHLYLDPPRPSQERPDISTGFDAVVARGMAKDPDQRYQTSTELADAAHDAITTPLAPPSAPNLLGDAPPRGPALRDDQVRPMLPPPPAPAPVPVWPRPGDVNLAATPQRPPGWQPPTKPAPASPPAGASIPPRWWRRKVNRRTAIAVLAVPVLVCVAAVVFAGATLRLYLADRAVADARRAIVQTATNAITTLWTYTPENMDTLADRAAQYLGDDFEAQYRKFVDAIVAPNKQAQVTNTTQVVGAGVESLSGSEATAVVFTNTTSTTPQTRDKPSIKYLSYRLVMQKHDSRWVITKMTTITSQDFEPKFPVPG